MLRDALDHYNQQKDEVNRDDTLPAAAAKLTLTKRSDKTDEFLTAFDPTTKIPTSTAQSTTKIPTSTRTFHDFFGDFDHHEDDHGDHAHDGELPKDWHYDEGDDSEFADIFVEAYEDLETDDDDIGAVSPETITNPPEEGITDAPEEEERDDDIIPVMSEVTKIFVFIEGSKVKAFFFCF